MKSMIFNINRRPLKHFSRQGFTLIELLIGSSIMLVVILATLALYMESNRITVDQQQFTEVQHDVRSCMFFIQRDARSAGVGLSEDIIEYFIEGEDGFGPGPESSDSLKIMGNFENPLKLRIEDYQGHSATIFLYDGEYENQPYDCPDDYENKVVLVVSTTNPGCFGLRFIGDNDTHGCQGGVQHINFVPAESELNPPGGLSDTGCDPDDYDDGMLTFIQIKQYWLDTTGNPGDYPEELGLVIGEDGYLGIPYTLYLTSIDETGNTLHMPLAQNIENLQFQYNGDLDDDEELDGFENWNDEWSLEEISRIRQVKIWVLGRTPNPFVSVSGEPPEDIHLYVRPGVANSPLGDEFDRRRRFLLESTVNIRNMSLNLYNLGTR